MKKLMITLFALTIGLSSLTSCSSDSESATNTTNTTDETVRSYTHSALELELLDEVNTYRVSVGLNPLEIIEHISYKSSEHNDYMLSTQTVTHEGFDERKSNLQEVLGAYRVGENVAFAFSSAEATVNAWVNSASHKANLEGDYTHFGASIKIDDQGRKYYTNMFIKK
ncbi:CAP domain-containing protein [Flavobacterium lacisediminis]|uniref:CAP domain-containing protein n=1 Tax=Flavobacterium lacisediminis TaxID=2989705 RepID=A0ABT3EKA0_9FLAO|nr:CAP domain-containing protein [Flavobacterium lacisediminis]MCW1148993.1 CAP domain-containing protein [Flavobacterium lacisediminis]